MEERSRRAFVRAAGGIVWRNGDRRELAVVYRDRYAAGECCLPKGKLDAGEDWARAAVREVWEETCCEAEILGFGEVALYHVGETPKAVVYFEMRATRETPFRPSREVRKLAWLAPAQALGALTHGSERDALRKCLARAGLGS